jgi:hypothetical protein
MQTGLQHKMQMATMPPPIGAWEQIASALDEKRVVDVLPSLQDFNITPPSFCWENIDAQINTSRLSTLLPSILEASIEAPKSVWQNIVSKLSSEVLAPQAILQQMEVMPPSFVWQHIEQKLHQEQQQTVAQPRKRGLILNLNFAKAAAAALVIGVVSFGVFKWVNTDDRATEVAKIKPTIENNQAENKQVEIAVEKNNNPAESNNSNKNISSNNIATVSTENIINPNTITNNTVVKPQNNNQPTIARNIEMPKRNIGVVDAINNEVVDIVRPNGVSSDANINNTNIQGSTAVVVGPSGAGTQGTQSATGTIPNYEYNRTETKENLDKIIEQTGMWKQKIIKWNTALSNKILTSATMGGLLDEIIAAIEENKKPN